ncbi:MAG: TolC family protein [Ferruginibacter sp.]
MRKLIFPLILTCVALSANCQQKWDLRTVVEYAMINNISVKLSDVQSRIAAVDYKQSRLSQIPNFDLSSNTAYNSGNNQDPTSFQRVTQTYISAGFQLQSSADIFNFFSKRNSIAAYDWELRASKAYVDKVKNDIALTAANGYLQVLLSKEQENITLVQVKQTDAQLANTRRLVNAGALPELNATQLEAQLALDSGNYISARGGVTLALLTLRSYLNIDPATPFEVETPPVEMIPVEPIADLQPDVVFKLAVANQPLQRYNDFRLKAAEKNKAAARGAMYPTLSAFGNLGSNYISAKTPSYIPVITGYSASGAIVNVSGTDYDVLAPDVTLSKSGYTRSDPFASQVSDNFRQSVGLSLGIPLFRGYTQRSNYERSKLNLNTLQLQKEQDDQKLKQDIYQAYTSALTALEKFNASRKAVTSAERTYEFASKRFDVGLLGTFDLVTSQNNLLRAKLDYTINQFDYVFKMKVLEFYKGLGLKL